MSTDGDRSVVTGSDVRVCAVDVQRESGKPPLISVHLLKDEEPALRNSCSGEEQRRVASCQTGGKQWGLPTILISRVSYYYFLLSFGLLI